MYLLQYGTIHDLLLDCELNVQAEGVGLSPNPYSVCQGEESRYVSVRYQR